MFRDSRPSCRCCSGCSRRTLSAASRRRPAVAFTTDVRPLLTKLGCNSGGCHGKATGQNGFKLSLLGYEPADDYEAIVRECVGTPDLLPPSPEKSLVLLKATGAIPHGGGRLLAPDSEDYDVLRRWIEQGAPPPRPDDPVVRAGRDRAEGRRVVAERPASLCECTASFSDGSTRDVTRLALYESNEPDVAEVSPSGVIQIKDRGGLFAVMVRYGDQFGVFHGTVPFHTPTIGGLDVRGQSKPVVGRPVAAATVAAAGDRAVAAGRRRDVPPPREPGHLRHAARRPTKSAPTSPTLAPTSAPA